MSFPYVHILNLGIRQNLDLLHWSRQGVCGSRVPGHSKRCNRHSPLLLCRAQTVKATGEDPLLGLVSIFNLVHLPYGDH